MNLSAHVTLSRVVVSIALFGLLVCFVGGVLTGGAGQGERVEWQRRGLRVAERKRSVFSQWTSVDGGDVHASVASSMDTPLRTRKKGVCV